VSLAGQPTGARPTHRPAGATAPGGGRIPTTLTGRGRRLGTAWLLAALLVLVHAPALGAQQADILLKGGHVIDPRNGIDGPMDVAIAGGRILQVARDIPVENAIRVVDATGLYVTPGLVDLHGHLTEIADPPDGFTFRAGVTTLVDAGTYGWRDWEDALRQIEAARTRVLAFLAITGAKGDFGGGHGRDLLVQDLSDYDPVVTAAKIRQHRDVIVGVKIWKAPEFRGIELGVEAGRLVDMPVMIDFNDVAPSSSYSSSLEELFLRVLRPGDIYTHMYSQTPAKRIVDGDGRLQPFVRAARDRGIVFDVGHGGGAFSWGQAVPASQQGFFPDVISTDLHRISMNGGMKDMTNVMSKFLNLGMSLQQVIHASTWRPAQVIRREELGHLSVGAEADVAVFTLREGRFGFLDSQGRVNDGTQKLEAELTLRAGEIVWDLNGIAGTRWDE
jgi:dihydroorotase